MACGYCTMSTDNSKRLPLQCRVCQKLFHLNCLNCDERPTALYGDQLFDFHCSFCSGDGVDTWTRLNLNWVHVIHLALYNLMISEKGRDGFFRWNTGICKYIESHWSDLMPFRYKTSSWQCTVAGTLSVNCPAVFRSGTQVLGETGWWSLQETTPPKLVDVLKTLSGERIRKGTKTDSRKRSTDQIEEMSCSKKVKQEREEEIPYEDFNTPDESLVLSQVVPLTERQETALLNFMCQFAKNLCLDSCSARLFRKLKIRQRKRELGQPVFNLSQYVHRSLLTTKHYISNEANELPIPLIDTQGDFDSFKTTEPVFPLPVISKARAILSRLASPMFPVLVTTPKDVVLGDGRFVSPYTSHLLTRHIFISSSFSPPKLQVHQELVLKVLKGTHYQVKPLIFSYFRKHHLLSVNTLVSYFLWPVDLTEYLQYPDFTVVVLYGKLVVGCGFMTPDVTVSEAYIPFLLVHPDFQCCGIGKVMLYHLIQSCQGKDVILHVSVDNPAMLLYQKFGFKMEQFCINFYDKYYPPKYHLSKHAFLMRLRR